jgi:hypothetical protein
MNLCLENNYNSFIRADANKKSCCPLERYGFSRPEVRARTLNMTQQASSGYGIPEGTELLIPFHTSYSA